MKAGLLSTVIGGLVAAAGAQQPSFRARAEIVHVEVAVLDANWQPVRDLTAEDFTVTENGARRPVTAFSVVPPSVDGRLVTIVFDRSMSKQDLDAARRIAGHVVDRLEDADAAAVTTVASLAAGMVPPSFTTDRLRLRAAIDAAKPIETRDPDVSARGGDCACGRCVPDALVRLADGLGSLPGRHKMVHFLGAYFRKTARSDGSACADAWARARDAIDQARARTDVAIDMFDPADGRGVGEQTAFLDPQYVIGYEPPSRVAGKPVSVVVKVNRPGVRGLRWVFCARSACG